MKKKLNQTSLKDSSEELNQYNQENFHDVEVFQSFSSQHIQQTWDIAKLHNFASKAYPINELTPGYDWKLLEGSNNVTQIVWGTVGC